MSHHNNFRNLLHKTKLDAFEKWAVNNGYKSLMASNPEKNLYECLRLELYSPEGNNPHLVFYKRLKGDHISIPKDAVDLVKQFLDETRSKQQKSQTQRRKDRRRRMFEKHGKEAMDHCNAIVSKASERTLSKDEIQTVMSEVEEMNLPDGAYWALVHEKLDLEYGDLFPLLETVGIITPLEEHSNAENN